MGAKKQKKWVKMIWQRCLQKKESTRRRQGKNELEAVLSATAAVTAVYAGPINEKVVMSNRVGSVMFGL